MADIFNSIGGLIQGGGKLLGQGLSALDPSNIRKGIAGFGSLAGKDKAKKGETSLTGIEPSKIAGDREWRVTLRDDDNVVIGPRTFKPLEQTYNGVLFPYTPQISMSYKANYEMVSGTQTNYAIPTYTNSDVDSIQIRANFTANNQDEANYLLAALHFLRSSTKSSMGQDFDIPAGSPPPILYLYGYGEGMFNKVPVIVQSVGFSLPADTDYISTGDIKTKFNDQSLTITRDDGGNVLPGQEAADSARVAARAALEGGSDKKYFGSTRVPTNLDMDISLKVIYTRRELKEMSTQDYRRGNLLKQGYL